MTHLVNPQWREWPIEKLEKEYSPSVWAKAPSAVHAPIFEASALAARTSESTKLRFDSYGPRTRNVIAWSAPTEMDEIFVWIHGGYWQDCTIGDSMVGVVDLVAAGFGYAAIEYSLAPEVTVAEIIAECVSALKWVIEQNPEKKIILGGHSAGAHLALAVALQIPVTGLSLVAGVYDLRPLVPTTINDKLGMSDESAAEVSPILNDFAFPGKSEVLIGGFESASFLEQSHVATAYLIGSGSSVSFVPIADCDHKDIIATGEHIKSFRRLVQA